jgi:feruloyl esterase
MQKIAGVVLLLLFLGTAHSQSSSCEKLAQIALPQAKITLAQTVAAGAFPAPTNLPSWMANVGALLKSLPAFCRVTADGQPSADSDIKIEVWMPASGWNGKFHGQGNGGFAGYIDYPAIALAVSHGYASAGTDTGHSSSGGTPDASWALRHPQKVVDYGYRAIHQMTEIAKTMVTAFYGSKPHYSYFGSCSNGGRQALMEAQRFPEDYDGILAGAPANFWTHLLANGLWDTQATMNDPASYIPASKIPAIAAAVNAACDAQDGVSDGILNDPRKCHFDPEALLCKNGDSDKCLTRPQTIALRKLYEGARDSTGQIYPGFLPGAEDGEQGWLSWITGASRGHSLIFSFTNGFFANMVYDSPNWDYKTADVSEANKAADKKQAGNLNATNPNLEPFQSRGGKLILYHGWNDPAISSLNTINYYDEVVRQMGERNTGSFVRLYMVPGMQHCGGGPGASSFGQSEAGLMASQDPGHNIYLALETWVEKGTAPDRIIATKYAGQGPSVEVKMTRPLCPYPEEAEYKGSGDSNTADNFACVGPRQH